DVLEGQVDPSVFHDKLVLVGLINSEGQTDLHEVPLGVEGTRLAGVEIHANAIETLLQVVPLRPQSSTSQFLMIVALAFFSSMIYDHLPQHHFNGWLLVAVILGVLVWVVVGALIFSSQLVVVNLFHSLLAIVLPAPTLLAGRLVGEVRQRQRVELLLDSIIRASGQQLNLERIIPEIGVDLHRILGCEHVEIWLWNKKQKSAFCAYKSSEKLPLEHSETLVKKALQDQTSCYQEKMMAFPMFWQYQPLGVLVGYPLGRLRKHTRETLELFVRQMGILLANIYLLEEARQLSELKTFVIRMASHDLKNPLTAIVSFSFFLIEDHRKQNFLSKEHLEFVEDIQRAASQMQAIINN
ncbi:MAG: CHASE2 domain-containing protein, partial [Anaerolineae bacterium]|nr:CHASE2 domain-containing protein [Anaerolineae bacterium]